MSAEPKRVAGLDGLRALAVLGVMLSHAGVFGVGWVGVDIFFGLSGYLITGILLDAKVPGASAKQYFVAFYMRRVLRILPLAWAFALVMAVVHGKYSGLLWYLGYVVNWLPASPPPDVLGHYWSLAVEEQFYTVWPAIVFLVSRSTLLRISCGVLVADAICRLVVSSLGVSTPQFRDLATFARADSLIVGSLLAQLERGSGWGKKPVAWSLPIAIAAGLGVMLLRALEHRQIMPLAVYNLKWPIVALGVGSGLLYVLTSPPRFLEWRPLVWIGKVSYGVYVINAAFGSWLHEHFTLRQAPLIFLIQLTLTLPLAALSYYFFESPILSLKSRWKMPGHGAAPVPARTSDVGAGVLAHEASHPVDPRP
jgi:peptidoglycan/LPS O-acetylase OafA/YrhL